MRIFLDANILFSASDKKSATRFLFDLLVKEHEVIVNLHAWEEARRNIELKRPDNIEGLNRLKKNIIFTQAFNRNISINLPPEDMPIIAGAIGSKCSHLWTGDRKHFGKYFGQTVNGVKIVSGEMLMDELE